MKVQITTAGANLVSNTKDFFAECKTKPVACAGRAVTTLLQATWCVATTATAAASAYATAGAVTNLAKDYFPSVTSHLPSCLDATTKAVQGSSVVLTAGVMIVTYAMTKETLGQMCNLATKFFGAPKAKRE